MRNINNIYEWENALTQPITMQHKEFQTKSCNQRVDCLLDGWDLEPLDLPKGVALGFYPPSPE